jgi:hypothetical protein
MRPRVIHQDPLTSCTRWPSRALPSRDPTPTAEETFDPTEETARQFIRRWIRTDDEMQVSGDTAEFRKLHGPECSSCEQLAAFIEEVYEHGGAIETEPVSVVEIHRDTKDQWTVHLEAPETAIRKTADAEVERLAGGPFTLIVYLERTDGNWKIIDYFTTDEAA